MASNDEKIERNLALYIDRQAGMTYEDIAEKYDVSISRANVLVRRQLLRDDNTIVSAIRKSRPCADPYNHDTGVEVFYHRDGTGPREFVATADGKAEAKKVARQDAKETDRPLRHYYWHRRITTVQPLFAQDTDERPSKVGVSYE
jgi:hypothetical protein